MALRGVRSLDCLIAILLLAAFASAKPRSFQQLVDAYFDDSFKANPSQATGVGFHEHDQRLQTKDGRPVFALGISRSIHQGGQPAG